MSLKGLFLDEFFKIFIRSKLNINADIMKAQICHTMKYDVKGRESSNKALVTKLFLEVIH